MHITSQIILSWKTIEQFFESWHDKFWKNVLKSIVLSSIQAIFLVLVWNNIVYGALPLSFGEMFGQQRKGKCQSVESDGCTLCAVGCWLMENWHSNYNHDHTKLFEFKMEEIRYIFKGQNIGGTH